MPVTSFRRRRGGKGDRRGRIRRPNKWSRKAKSFGRRARRRRSAWSQSKQISKLASQIGMRHALLMQAASGRPVVRRKRARINDYEGFRVHKRRIVDSVPGVTSDIAMRTLRLAMNARGRRFAPGEAMAWSREEIAREAMEHIYANSDDYAFILSEGISAVRDFVNRFTTDYSFTTGDARFERM